MMELDGVKFIDITDIADRNFWMYMFTKSHPDTKFTSRTIEGRRIVFPVADGNEACLLFYTQLFEFHVENGLVEMMWCPSIKDEQKQQIKEKLEWSDGELVISPINPEDPKYRRFENISFKSLDITKARNFTQEAIDNRHNEIKAEIHRLTQAIDSDVLCGTTSYVPAFLKEIEALNEELQTHFSSK
jgi:hypothetical protein